MSSISWIREHLLHQNPPRLKNHYGWVPQQPDDRDFKFEKVVEGEVLPASTDLTTTGFFPPVYNQGELGSCTANAIAGAIQFNQKKEQAEWVMPSRLFIYYFERDLEGTVSEDSGAQIRDGFKVLKSKGYISEQQWPYVIDQFAAAPPAADVTEAVHFETSAYYSVDGTLAALKSALASGYPIVFGIVCFEGLESQTAAETGVVPMPGFFDKAIGGHAILLVGYDDSKQYFKFRNSWGEGWGDQGYGYLPYNYVANSNYASDFWVLDKVVAS